MTRASTPAASDTATRLDARKSRRQQIRNSIPLYVLLLPSAILLFCFAYLPMGGIVMAFQRYSPALGFFKSPWVGFDNFIQFFNSYQFSITIKNTFILSIYGMLVGFPLSIGLALMCNQMQTKMFKKVFQVVTYLPHFISTMVMCGLILIFLSPSSGIMANLFRLFGAEAPNVMASSSAFPHVYVWSDVWQHLGWDSIIYLAALSAVDPTYYEAATLDGASKLQKIWYIDIPMLMPTFMTMLILRAGSILGIGFEKVFLLQNTTNLAASEILSTYVYKMGIQNMNYSLSAAIGLFNTLVNVVVLLIVNFVSQKLTDNSIF
ncbi:MAG: sugar ABC transporter permease [Subdoligranulum sp.]|nr:sugar ABC transporter permease [Subdoligranulum sp.]MBD5103042.1 sugar ABC transporter permease [Subdoligranulum sp.]